MQLIDKAKNKLYKFYNPAPTKRVGNYVCIVAVWCSAFGLLLLLLVVVLGNFGEASKPNAQAHTN